MSGLYTRHGDLDLSIEGQATWWVGFVVVVQPWLPRSCRCFALSGPPKHPALL